MQNPGLVMDLALLILQQPVPVGVQAAPLRCPKTGDLISCAWWAFGFPSGDPVGNWAEGEVGAALGYGWVRLDTRSDSRYFVRPGFSGGGLWSRDYAAVVGVVGQAHSNGDGRAITLHQADLSFPDQELKMLARWSVEAAGDVALQQWGWTLAQDPEGVRHWRPRARGVSIESERGYGPWPDGRFEQDCSVVGPARIGPAGPCCHRLAGGRKVGSAGPHSHHCGLGYPLFTPN